ncbi:MAG: hypothetical protein PHY59_08140 [Methanobacterium sp.]|nr:hypothetical protein [Methanobacterium sp.]
MENMLQANKSKPLDCKMNAHSSVTVMGWACDKTDCRAYGTCPFSW